MNDMHLTDVSDVELNEKLPRANDALQTYMRDILRIPLLPKEETARLIALYMEMRDPAVHKKLVNHNLRLVVKVAYKYKASAANMMDLIQEGNLGLMRGIEKFDPSKGVPLSNYVCQWISANIIRHILRNHRLVRLGTTEDQRKIFWNLSKIRAKLEAQGLPVTTENLAAHLKVSESDVAEMQQRMGSHEMSLYDSEGKDLPIEAEGQTPDSLLETEQFSASLRTKLEEFKAKLNPKKVEVFTRRFLKDPGDTFHVIADDMVKSGLARSMTRQRVQQIEADLRKDLAVFLKDFSS